ncbi:MAG: hypothetical protein A2741_00610 [Candidatus Zambryskibacteria bacterium RIFCSPHIGHO2_01_FULL_43_27]|uniref:Uncharacterized protein n=1 Tax=Candidatus Zambryskibacteria bacterium RIFCSPLOWO2_01_FULL_43_17 TaxID=1802760 RepID=A0A1G2U3T1_9BACT|nr:MAG: hypothetical protein A2741_00610 [Candidatus Zambryskibacteria bacterium RIFCSPHIGHO2_01_FULL_43_27]OHA99642.1 MAG: hypothetical protein A3E93_00730 [Candidatus Zambryskibacteria bacterium RIFCSPHIGHO2_12_FULL_43_12b]OHB04129.1 MAG: hypothetical protein A2920_02205 [Candidatus Zambryskibacteria bacterium RIFCSPLOWO2_01_FULL_43_17]
MNSDLYFDGKKFISSSRAAKISGYVNDYIGQLCRDGKLDCRMVGRSWYVSYDSLQEHRKLNNLASKNRSKKSVVLSTRAYSVPESSVHDVQIISDEPIALPEAKQSDGSLEVYKVPISISEIAPVTIVSKHKIVDSHHRKFAVQFPNLVAGAIALLLSLAGFQTVLSLNPQAEITYRNFGNEVRNSIALVSEISGNEISASIFSGIRSQFDAIAQNFYLKVNGVLFDARTKVLVMIGREEIEEVATNVDIEQAGSQDGQGMVVVPVDEKTDKDAVIAKIQNSFSDEVQVTPRADGTSGVITPVFKKISNDEYLYVLVPIKN